jgi:hypothetical protein
MFSPMFEIELILFTASNEIIILQKTKYKNDYKVF